MMTAPLMDLMVEAAVNNFATLHLAAAPVEYADEMVRGDFIEPSGKGYAPISIDRGEWKFSPGEAVYPEVAFAIDEQAGKVCGWFICDADGKVMTMMMAEAPYEFGALGALIKVEPAFSVKTRKTKVKVKA